MESDEEFDKKIRDKFRGERNESFKGMDSRREDRVSDGWGARSRGRGDYRNNSMRDRFSPIKQDGPPSKRMRNEWDNRNMAPMRPGYYDAPSFTYASWMQAETQSSPITSRLGMPVDIESQPQMMTLKAFLNTLDDNISDDEALKKYNDYKLDFKKQQLNEFFISHKDEEWFKEKYDPVLSAQRNEEHLSFLKKRVEVFEEFFDRGWIDQVVDSDQGDELLALMDSFVIKLEGGTDTDLKVVRSDMDSLDTSPNKENDHVGNGETSSEDLLVDQFKVKDVKRRSLDEQINSNDAELEEEGEITANANSSNENARNSGDSDEDDVILVSGNPEMKPRELHRTTSVFLRNLSPMVTRKELQDECEKFPGFLRLTIAEPQPEKRWFRRGWVTYSREVDVKEVCWALSAIRMRDYEMHPMVNRDLSRRIRTVTPITNLKTVVRSDLKLCAKIISQFDKKYKLWQDSDRPIEERYGLNSRNPVLQNITEYLVEEASAEEEALLGEVSETTEEAEEKDPNVFKILDRMIWYLRLVHSIDYYNHSLYLNEDEMPNRCGIMHARIMSSVYKCSQAEVAEYCKSFESKLSALLNPMPKELSEQELIDLGAKSADAEVEKFILANTQELGPEKWLCPLSGKKFKGPEFVRKHIENKHAEKLDEVRREVAYFNNYLKDEQRPHVPEAPINRPKANELSSSASQMVPTNPFYGGYGNAWGAAAPGYGPPISYGYSRPQQPMRNNYGRGRGSHRPIVNYRDLDAPKEPDEFI